MRVSGSVWRAAAMVVAAMLCGVGLQGSARAAAPPGPAGVPAATYAETACPDDLEVDDALRARLSCGTVQVPELRDGRPTRMLSLPVMRMAPREPSDALPVLVLHGGPGGSAVPHLRQFADHPLTGRHPLILFDQRGGDRTSPRICPDRMEVRAFDLRDDGPAAQMRDCLAELRAKGGAPEGYTVAAVAADAADLRRALGLAAWDVFAESHGTLVALVLMAQDPDGLHAVALDSTVPPWSAVTDGVRQGADVLVRLARACAAEAPCAAAFPDLEARFLAEAERRHAAGQVRLATWLGVLQRTFYDPNMLRVGPLLIDRFAAGETGWFRLMGRRMSVGRPTAMDGFLAISCSRFDPAREEAEAVAARAAFPQIAAAMESDSMARACAEWPVREALPFPEGSPVRTLLIHGTFDPITPVEHGRAVAARLADARVLEVPAASHGSSLARPCGREALRLFFDGQDPSAACAGAEPLRFALSVPYLTGGWLNATLNPVTATLGQALTLALGPAALLAVFALVRGLVRGGGLRCARRRPWFWLQLAVLVAAAARAAQAVAEAELAKEAGALLILGVPQWFVPVLAAPWIVLALGVAAALRWRAEPGQGPATPGSRAMLGLGIVLAGVWFVVSARLGLALGL